MAACNEARFDKDDWYICKITGDSCRFISPDSNTCIKRFGKSLDKLKIKNSLEGLDGQGRKRKL